MKSLGIKYQLRLTTVIPVLLVALLFALFYNGQFGKDLQQHASRLGEAYIRQLLPAAQFALMRNDSRTLQGLINASIVNPEVKALAFYNANGELIAYRGGKHSLHQPFTPPEFTGDFIESKQINPLTINFIAPITIQRYNLYSKNFIQPGVSPIITRPDDILGWLSIDIDTQSMLIKRYQMLIVTIFITLFGLLIGLSIHYFLSKQIYVPISRLRRSMKQILSNEFETRIKGGSAGEMGIIEQGCQHLQRQYLNTVKDMNQHIEVATIDLQQSLELLEEKNIELLLEKKKADEKSRQKSEFIANMSHEIRTPMNGVIGFTNVLLESKLDPLQLDYVKTIKSSAQDLLNIINDILDYSKMDAGKLHLDHIPVDLRACVDEVLALTSPGAHKKGLDVIPITEIDVPKTVVGDPLRIKQILTNLIHNAIKFTEQGYVTIRTRIVQENERDYVIEMAITDTGIGIAAEDQGKLFTAFNQADTTITRRYGGSGLGLVICKKLAEQMQGKIGFSSEQNKGSTFTVQVRLEKLSAYEVEKNQTRCFADLQVICYDEHPLHMEALCNGLRYWGIDCIAVTHLNQLKQAFSQNPDCQMAFINVNEDNQLPLKRLIEEYAKIPCILISKSTIRDYQSLGGTAFLYKPISIQKLHDLIEAQINQKTINQPHNPELQTLRDQLRLQEARLLIAEDNPVNRMLLQSLLQDYARIDLVEDGAEAAEAAMQQRYHVILLDLQMPNVNGLDAAKQIRSQSLLNKQTPIILISANIEDLKPVDLKKAGIELCLSKPIDEQALLSHLLKQMSRQNQRAIDWDLCVQKVSGNTRLAEEYLDQFISELRKNRDEFMTRMNHKDVKALAELAHKLHGACCFCGVPQLQSHTVQLEKLCQKTNKIELIEPIFVQLIQSIDAVLNEFETQY